MLTPSQQAVAGSSKVPLHLLSSRLNRSSSLKSCSCMLCSIPDSVVGSSGLWYICAYIGQAPGSSGWFQHSQVGSYHCRVKDEVPHPTGCTLGDTALNVLLCRRALSWGPTQLIRTTAPLPPNCFPGSPPCPAEFKLLPPRPRTIFDHLHLSLPSFLRVFSSFL